MTDTGRAIAQTEYALLPYQQAWINDKSPVKVCEKSRRIGISWAEAADAVLLAATAGRAGSDVWYLSYNESNAKIFLSDAAFWAKTLGIAASQVQQTILEDEAKSIKALQISFASGYTITGLSSRPTNLRGKSGRTIVDEASFVPDLGEVMKAALALLMWGGSLHIISTHNGIDSPFNLLIQDIKAGKRNYSLHKITFDDALEQGLYRRICATQGKVWTREAEQKWRESILDDYGEDAIEELFCVPKSNTQVYFPSLLVEARMRAEYAVIQMALPDSFVHKPSVDKRWQILNWLEEVIRPHLLGLAPDERHSFGFDFGRSGDLSSLAIVAERKDLIRYAPLVIEMRNVPFEQQEQIIEYVVEGLPMMSGGCLDARGNGQSIAEWAGNLWGNKIAQLKLSNNDYAELVPKYKQALENGEMLLPKSSDILADHRAVRLINGIPKIPETSRYKDSSPESKESGKASKRHGDSFISLMLGYSAACKHPIVEQTIARFISSAPGRSNVREMFQTNKWSTGRSGARNIFG